ncbi:MAG TPA: MXAN_6640 family putative metalloprotease [Nocardioides sp.]|nr:MXAN_6640 family putative metalloprotease [Nocardioides sp.]
MLRISGRTRVLSLVLATTLAAFGTTGGGQPAHASPATAATHLRPTMTHAQATDALSRADLLFHGTRAQSRMVQRHEDATMLLRDLRVAYPTLSPAQRQQADRLFARPGPSDNDPEFPVVYTGTEQEECSAIVPICVHYDVTSGDPGGHNDATNGVDPTDGPDANTTPDYVDAIVAMMEHVWQTYAAAGYRMPLSDVDSTDNGNIGGQNASQTDIYLGELSRYSLYGFCTSDDPRLDDTTTFFSYASAYCVLDNNYAHAEYPFHTPLENAEVTAAHEFFHAVQFSYDFYEDRWLMEATATWAEDQLYTSINDNVQYLSMSPITRPDLPLDYGTSNDNVTSLHWYGTWIFFRFLTEREVTTKAGGLPVLIRDIWRRLDANKAANPSAPDLYSLQGVRSALAAHGISFTTAMSQFDLAARHPTKYFSEARANHYPAAPVAISGRVGPGFKNAWTRFTLKHLSYRVLRLIPKSGMSRAWHLRVHLDLPTKAQGAAATLWINKKSGGTSAKLITLSAKGDATFSIPFNSAQIASVEIEVINASARFNHCFNGFNSSIFYSCVAQHGQDDGTSNFVQATAYKA